MRAGFGLLGVSVLLIARASSACDSDSQCKGDRVCENGTCVTPSAKKPKKADEPKKAEEPPPKVKPKKSDDEDAAEEETPKKKKAPVDDGDDSGEPDKKLQPRAAGVEPPSSVWSGAKAPVNIMIGLILGDSFRANSENVLFGFGGGLQVAFLTGNSFVGLHWHEHLINEKTETRPGTFGGNVTLTARGRSSYYTVEAGQHVRLSEDFFMRLLVGIGLLRTSVAVSASDGTSISGGEYALIFEPGIGFFSRWIGKNWYSGVQLSSLMNFTGIASFNLYAGLGYAF